MEKIFRKAVVLMCLPIILNVGITVWCFNQRGIPQFKGYFIGTLLSMFFSIVWVFIARRALTVNIMAMFTVTLASFPIKIIVLAIIAFTGLFLFKMDQFYFGTAFLLGTLLSLFVEVWFLIAGNRFQRAKKGIGAPSVGK